MFCVVEKVHEIGLVEGKDFSICVHKDSRKKTRLMTRRHAQFNAGGLKLSLFFDAVFLGDVVDVCMNVG